MAREASGGMLSYDAEGNWRLNETEVAHFAALIARHEREACAKVADLVAREIDDTNGTATYIAAAIRARGEA
jgi:hypothetical protein